MSEASNKEIVTRLFAAMSALELDVIDELVSPDVVARRCPVSSSSFPTRSSGWRAPGGDA